METAASCFGNLFVDMFPHYDKRAKVAIRTNFRYMGGPMWIDNPGEPIFPKESLLKSQMETA